MTACEACLRRTWLIARLAAHIERARHGRERLRDVLALADEALVAAVGGSDAGRDPPRPRRRAAPAPLRAAVAAAGLDAVCRHDDRYPPALRDDAGGPAVLHVAGGPAAWPSSSARRRGRRVPAVAVVGARRAQSRRPSRRRTLGRGLAAPA